MGFGEAPYFCKVSKNVPEPAGEMVPRGQQDQDHPALKTSRTDSVSQADNASMHLCTSAISLVWSNLTFAFFAPQMFTNKTIPALNAGKEVRCNARLPLLFWRSTTWLQDLAAFAQMAREGKESGEGLSGFGMNGR
jgi:hypothetical protein